MASLGSSPVEPAGILTWVIPKKRHLVIQKLVQNQFIISDKKLSQIIPISYYILDSY